MFSGVKFIPRDQLPSAEEPCSGLDGSGEEKRKFSIKKSKMKKRSNQVGRDSDTSLEVDSDKMISTRGKRVKSKSKKHKRSKRGYSSHDDDDNSQRTSGSESLDNMEESKIKRSKRSRRNRRRPESSEDNYSSSSDEYGKEKGKMKKHQHKRKTERRDAKDIQKEEFFEDADDNAKDLLHHQNDRAGAEGVGIGLDAETCELDYRE